MEFRCYRQNALRPSKLKKPRTIFFYVHDNENRSEITICEENKLMYTR